MLSPTLLGWNPYEISATGGRYGLIRNKGTGDFNRSRVTAGIDELRFAKSGSGRPGGAGCGCPSGKICRLRAAHIPAEAALPWGRINFCASRRSSLTMQKELCDPTADWNPPTFLATHPLFCLLRRGRRGRRGLARLICQVPLPACPTTSLEAEETGMDGSFALPYCGWQRGTHQNTNGCPLGSDGLVLGPCRPLHLRKKGAN